MGVEDNIPLEDIIFEMEMSLCDRFQILTPISLRKEKARDVLALVVKYNKYAKRQKKNTTKDGKRIIRKPASDNWF